MLSWDRPGAASHMILWLWFTICGMAISFPDNAVQMTAKRHHINQIIILSWSLRLYVSDLLAQAYDPSTQVTEAGR